MSQAPPPMALLLGALGLIPFYASAGAIAFGGPLLVGIGATSFAVYAATILSFLGGARWGLELARAPEAPSPARLVYSVLPSIAGWAAALWTMLGPAGFGTLRASMAAFFIAFAAQYVWDAASVRTGAPAWYPRLRLALTAGVLIACAAAGAAAIARGYQ